MKMTKSKLKHKVWEAFSWYVRLRDWRNNGEQWVEDRRAAPCITCSKVYPIEGKGCLQAGHFIPGRNNQVLFNEQQVHVQCYHCNHHLKGNWPAYYEQMVKIHGQDKVNQMIAESKQIKQYKLSDLEDLLLTYRAKIKGF